MRSSRVLAIGLAAGLSGCFPMQFNVSPGAAGRVVDSGTSLPVPDATVTLTQRIRGESQPAKSTRTDSSGRFLFIPAKSWGIYVVPMDFLPIRAEVNVVAPGYGNATCQVMTFPDRQVTTDCGDMRLDKLP